MLPGGRTKGGALREVITQLFSLAVAALFGAGMTWCSASIKHMRREQAALKSGVTCILRSELVDMHRRYVVEGRPCPVTEKERAEETYNAYHGLGGNGVGTKMWVDIRDVAKVSGLRHGGEKE